MKKTRSRKSRGTDPLTPLILNMLTILYDVHTNCVRLYTVRTLQNAHADNTYTNRHLNDRETCSQRKASKHYTTSPALTVPRYGGVGVPGARELCFDH
jgi:hypothetical protein